MKDVRTYVLNRVADVAHADDIAVGKALLGACKIRSQEIMDQIRTNPKHSPEDFKRDIVYLLGILDGLQFVISLPEEADKFHKKLEKGEVQ